MATETADDRRQRDIIAAVNTWHVAPQDQGQTIEHAYGLSGEHEVMARRITDRSDRSVTYQFAPAPERFEPWNQAPAADWSDAVALLPE